ncbi:MAG: hypothetical protein Q4D24_14035, partial [Erysipelotrichaceae bacterium]|nr:hypothetical protein [Erysipelotrichaceae bacterium]
MGKTRITNESYDEHLSFSLPKGYYTARVVDDEGEQNFQICAGETKDSEGNKSPKFLANVTFQEESSTTNSDTGIVLNGNYVNRIVGGSREMSLGPINFTIYIIGIGIDYKGSVYTISAQRAGIRDVNDWIEFLDTVIQSVRIDGESGSFDRFTQEMFESACESHDEIDDYGYPKATPDAGQHEHLDFLTKNKSTMSLFGGMLTVNATGTEYSFYRLSKVFDDDDDSARTKAIRTITNKGTSPFPLAEKAHQMSHIFRVSPDFFDPGH